MTSKASTPEEYIKELPADRKEPIVQLFMNEDDYHMFRHALFRIRLLPGKRYIIF